MNPLVLVGAFIGGMSAFLFCGMTMNAVGRAAQKMVDEVRRQFREILGIMEGTAEPDYAKCVEISTKKLRKKRCWFPPLWPSFIPIAVGILFGIPGVMGLLLGSTVTGFILAVFMANTGGGLGQCKNTLKREISVEREALSQCCRYCDTVGDPFKDTSGPSLNILIKLDDYGFHCDGGVTLSMNLLIYF